MEVGPGGESHSLGFTQTTPTAQKKEADEEQEQEMKEGSRRCECLEIREPVSTFSSGFWTPSFVVQLADQHSLDSLVGFYMLPDILGGVLLIFQSCHHATAEVVHAGRLGLEERKQVMLYLWLFAMTLTWLSLLLSFPFVVLAGFLTSDGFGVHLLSIAARVLALAIGSGAVSMVQTGFWVAQMLTLLMSMAMYRVMCLKLLSTLPTKIASDVDAISTSMPPESNMSKFAPSSSGRHEQKSRRQHRGLIFSSAA